MKLGPNKKFCSPSIPTHPLSKVQSVNIWMKRFIINFVYFSERYLFIVLFRLTTVNIWYERNMVWHTCCQKAALIELEMRLVIKRSSQWPWTWVGKLACCLRSKHVRIWLNLLVFSVWCWSRCMFKSPNIYKLLWSAKNIIMFSSKSWNSSKIYVPFWNLYRQTTKPLIELFAIGVEIASNVLDDVKGLRSVFNSSKT